MIKNHFKKTLLVLALCVASFSTLSSVKASNPPKCGVYGPTPGTNVVCTDGYETSNCGQPVSTKVTGVTEDRSFLVTLPWIGGLTHWDDQVELYGFVNDVVAAQANGVTFGSATCGSGVNPGYGDVGRYYFYPSSYADINSYQFQINALQRRNVGSSGNTFWGQAEYGFTQNYCAAGQMNVNHSCQWITGNISASPTSCETPCAPTINWSSYGMGTEVRRGDGSVLSTATSGNIPDSNLAAGTYTYSLYVKDGYGSWIGCCGVTVTVNASKSASLDTSVSQLSLDAGNKTGSGNVLNINSVNGGNFGVQCSMSSWGTMVPGSIVWNCPPGVVNAGTPEPFSVQVVSGAPTAPGTYNATFKISAVGNAGTAVSPSTKDIPIVYTIVGSPTPGSPAPTASLTVSGAGCSNPYNCTVPVGTNLTYTWSSTDGTSWSANQSSVSCSSGAWGIGPSASGSISGTTDASQPSCGKYTLTYTATNSVGSVTATVYVTVVAPASPVNGVCATPPNGGSYTQAPAGNLCSQGNASTVSGSGPWSWQCDGVNGGYSASCSANMAVPSPTCPAGTVQLSSPSVVVGSSVSASAPSGFSGGGFSSSNPSKATVAGYSVTGVAAGTSSISGSGWDYTPNGATGCTLSGTTITVNASGGAVGVGPNGMCGTANRTYPSGSTSYGSDTYCAPGIPSSSPAFPAAGNSASWICNAPSPVATGGTVVISQNPPGYTIHKFTSSGTFTPMASGNLEVLVIGGGGGGGSGYGNNGGGGSGGFIRGYPSVTAGTPYTVTIGAGGTQNTSGSNSVWNSTITAIGGGRGGSTNGAPGGSGGSGGGGAYTGGTSGGIATQGGGNGGSGDAAPYGYGAGGGGGISGESGGNGNEDPASGFGGTGLNMTPYLNSYLGVIGWVGGGGGGGNNLESSSGGQGGGGNGGSGGSGNSNGTNGTPNTGGGGGGSSGTGYTGGSGGSGIVIIEYQTPTTGSPSPQCTATNPIGPVNGVGGSACGKTYPSGSTSFGSDSICSAGTPNPNPVLFPPAGSSVSWVCTGSNGGSPSPQCTATNSSTAHSLEVTKTPGGYVKSNDGIISCGAACFHDYTIGSIVTLQAIPDSSYWKFDHWNGDCSGSGVCSLNINVPKSVSATFAPRPLNYQEF